jgi:hypothetical protein
MAGNMVGAILTAGVNVGGPVHLGLAPHTDHTAQAIIAGLGGGAENSATFDARANKTSGWFTVAPAAAEPVMREPYFKRAGRGGGSRSCRR